MDNTTIHIKDSVNRYFFIGFSVSLVREKQFAQGQTIINGHLTIFQKDPPSLRDTTKYLEELHIKNYPGWDVKNVSILSYSEITHDMYTNWGPALPDLLLL